MLNLTFAQTIFSGIGVVFVVLALIFCLIPKKREFGILSLLGSNLFLWGSIVYSKVISNLLLTLGLQEENLSESCFYRGVLFGLGLFILWYVIYFTIAKLLKRLKSVIFKGKPQDNEQESQDQVTKDKETQAEGKS